jgi:hypothetical protein
LNVVRLLTWLFPHALSLGGALYGLTLLDGSRLLETQHAQAIEPSVEAAPSRQLSEVALAPIRPAASAVDTFLGMADSLLSERMRSGEIKSLQFNRGGSSISFRIDFTDGSRAAFKPNQTNPQTVPRKEAAAYRLSRLLGLNLVAPAVMRTLHRDELLGKLAASSHWARNRVEAETLFDERGETQGSLAYWIPSVADLHLDTNDGVLRWTAWLSQGSDFPADKATLLGQLSTLLVFDLLQNNSDRFSGGNLLGSSDGHTLFYMDNAFGFQPDIEGHSRCWGYLRRAQKFSRSIVQALERLDREALQAAMTAEPGAPLLSDEEQTALLARRDRALAYIRGLCDEHGADRVLVFP